MSRLFTAKVSADKIAAQFGVEDAPNLAMPGEVVEGDRAPIVLEKDRRRILATASWGFPRLTRESKTRGAPPERIGLVADLTNPMWEHLVVEPRYRCLIPLTHFANPAGEKGEKTRSWFSVTDEPLTAWAGFCRNTDAFGPVFAGMTMTANHAVMPYNDRMPVLLSQDEYARWLNGLIEDVIAFQFRPPIASERATVLHTNDRWRSGHVPDFAAADQIELL